VLHSFASIDFQQESTMVTATQHLLHGMRDEALPVR
jgi:hypothetical protein